MKLKRFNNLNESIKFTKSEFNRLINLTIK